MFFSRNFHLLNKELRLDNCQHFCHWIPYVANYPNRDEFLLGADLSKGSYDHDRHSFDVWAISGFCVRLTGNLLCGVGYDFRFGILCNFLCYIWRMRMFYQRRP